MQDETTVQNNNINRIKIILITIIVVISLLVVRLAYIQIYRGDDLRLRAVSQWMKEIPIGVKRGKIYDRNMLPLTNKEKLNYLYIFPEHFTHTQVNLDLVSKITGISKIDLENDRLNSSRAVALEIKTTDQELLKRVMLLRGVFPIEYAKRYDNQGLAAHVLGYINKIDNFGEKGLEKEFDSLLKKNQGYKIKAIVDAQKRMIPGLGYKIIDDFSNEIKYDLVTTLDSRIQNIIEEELYHIDKKGSIIVLDSQSGDVLAMASRPNFDQNHVVNYLNSTNKELFNRAVQMTYPPGSTFKMAVLATALEEGIVDQDETFFCKGYEEINGIQIKCSSYDRAGHGLISLKDAFSLSCNSVFIQLGKRSSGTKLMQVAERLGFGNATGIELPEEVSGQLPTLDYMRGAGIGNISIGQGTIEVTPLQIAKMTLIIVNNGEDPGIRLVKDIISENGYPTQFVRDYRSTQVLSSTTARIIQSMMEKVVDEGTGNKINLDSYGGAAGKTGSAEASVSGKAVNHAWFTGYFPSKNPKYIITILIEDGGSGGSVAAPIFCNIAEKIILEINN